MFFMYFTPCPISPKTLPGDVKMTLRTPRQPWPSPVLAAHASLRCHFGSPGVPKPASEPHFGADVCYFCVTFWVLPPSCHTDQLQGSKINQTVSKKHFLKEPKWVPDLFQAFLKGRKRSSASDPQYQTRMDLPPWSLNTLCRLCNFLVRSS